MRIPSGVTDQYVYFVAVDATDYVTRETGLSSFTVYRSRNGAAAVAMTTPTVNEVDATNMPGVYELLLDEDMTIGAGNDTEEMVFHITASGMAPVTRTIELYRPKITLGNTLSVASDGDISGNVDGSVASVTAAITLPTIPANWITAAGIAASALNGKGNWNVGKTGYTLTQTFPANFSNLEITATTGRVTVGTNLDKSGYSVSGTITTLDGLNNLSAADVNAQVDSALADYDGPTKAEMDAAFTEIKGATFSGATDSLEAIRDRGDAAWTGGGSAPTVGEIADAVWSEAIADHSGDTGSTAEALAAAGSAGDPWTTSLPGSYTGTQAGKILADVLADTADLQANQGDWLTATVPTAVENADALLNRDMSAVSDTNARSPLNALRFLRNKWSVSGTTLTVTKENDSTTAWTASVTTNASAEPVTGSDPA